MKAAAYTYDPIFLKHDRDHHAENSSRAKAVYDLLTEKRTFEKLNKIECRPAKDGEILLCHTSNYLETVKQSADLLEGNFDPDTYYNQYTFEAASRALGGLLDLTGEVVEGKCDNGFSLVRPPGHHALADRAMGFCIFGNAAIAAKFALQNLNVERVAIIDFDVHHGNGTEALTAHDDRIFYASTHQFPHYPGTGSLSDNYSDGNFLCNAPLPSGAGDEFIIPIYRQIIVPLLRRFSPELIIVSAGFDAHWRDPLAQLRLSCSGFAEIVKLLNSAAEELSGGKIVYTLEGGYDTEALSYSVLNTISALLGQESFIDPIGKSDSRKINSASLLDKLRNLHKL